MILLPRGAYRAIPQFVPKRSGTLHNLPQSLGQNFEMWREKKKGVSRENGLFVDYVANNGKQIPGHRLQEKALVQKSCFHVASLRW